MWPSNCVRVRTLSRPLNIIIYAIIYAQQRQIDDRFICRSFWQSRLYTHQAQFSVHADAGQIATCNVTISVGAGVLVHYIYGVAVASNARRKQKMTSRLCLYQGLDKRIATVGMDKSTFCDAHNAAHPSTVYNQLFSFILNYPTTTSSYVYTLVHLYIRFDERTC